MDAEYGARYRELYERHWWWRAREDVILAELRQHGDGRMRSVLDVGCGDGLTFDALLGLPGVDHVEGIEPDFALLDPAGKHRANIHAGQLDATFSPRRRFSAILFLDVLEHLENPEDALRRAAGLLEPDGFILVTVPAFVSLSTRHDILNHHFTRFNRSTFGKLARESGLTVEASRYLFQWTAGAKLLIRIAEAVILGAPSPPHIPPPVINSLLYHVTRLEERILRPLHPPFGSSLLAVLRVSR